MSKAGVVLKQVLETYGIGQSELAKAMGLRRSSVHSWVKEQSDPASNAILEIRDALEKINPAAAEEFMRLWLDRSEN
ncbi:MAG: helix-turn-helix transcriptional regulator [Leptolyngbyaceae cyanobacterium SM1_3_5]|nr:helix-turn-helix transcriptional regulator [Leptolyngbyaceae cyanobacterium SM1_3_5]